MEYKYDHEADAVYIRISTLEHHHSQELDDSRFIDYAEDGSVIGVELLYVSGGVDTEGLPHREEIKQLLSEKGIKVFA